MRWVIALVVMAAVGVAFVGVARAADPATKTGKIESVDAAGKKFVVAIPEKPKLTFTCNDKTTYTLDGKESTMDAAVKVDLTVKVTYTRSGDDRIATKVEATTPAPAAKG